MKNLNSKRRGSTLQSLHVAQGEARRDVGGRFDNIARSVGGPMPRRKILKLAIVGIAGAALMELGFEPSWAAPTCLCNGQVYDPATSCCTSSGVQQKNPISNLSACPNRVPHPGHSPGANGCGPAGGAITPYIPDGYGSASFLSCCNNHDFCYGTCNNSKSSCDNPFFSCLAASCLDAYSGIGFLLLPSCLEVATLYFTAVSLGGGSAYNGAQSGACDCCGTTNCPQSCQGGSCSGAPMCENDAGCVCFQTVEGTGFCHRGQPCSTTSPCVSSAQCPAGWACINVTCCGPQSICVRPCTVIGQAKADFPMGGPMTTGTPKLKPKS